MYVDTIVRGKPATTILDTRATHNFIDEKEAMHLGLETTRGRGTIKAVNSEAKPAAEIAQGVRLKSAIGKVRSI